MDQCMLTLMESPEQHLPRRRHGVVGVSSSTPTATSVRALGEGQQQFGHGFGVSDLDAICQSSDVAIVRDTTSGATTTAQLVVPSGGLEQQRGEIAAEFPITRSAFISWARETALNMPSTIAKNWMLRHSKGDAGKGYDAHCNRHLAYLKERKIRVVWHTTLR